MTVVYHYQYGGYGRYPPINAYFVVEEKTTDIMDMIYTLKAEGWTSKRVAEETGLSDSYIRVLWNPKNKREIKTSAKREEWITRLDKLKILEKNIQPELDAFEKKLGNIDIQNNILGSVMTKKKVKATIDKAKSSYVQVDFNKTYKSDWNGRDFSTLKEHK